MRKLILVAPCLAFVLLACSDSGGNDDDPATGIEPTATEAEAVAEPTATEAAATVVANVEVPQDIVDLLNADIADGNISGISEDQQFVAEECGSPGLGPDDVCLRSDRTTIADTEATIAITYDATDSLWEVDLERDGVDGAWRISGVATFQ